MFHCSHRLMCWIKSRVADFLWQLISFHTEMISFGEVCYLEESYENMQKIQILKILRPPSIRHQGVCLNMSVHILNIVFFTALYSISRWFGLLHPLSLPVLPHSSLWEVSMLQNCIVSKSTEDLGLKILISLSALKGKALWFKCFIVF